MLPNFITLKDIVTLHGGILYHSFGVIDNGNLQVIFPLLNFDSGLTLNHRLQSDYIDLSKLQF